MTEDRPVGAREAARRRVRAALAGAARTLVAENGYDDTTIEMIAERAGVSRRTFFRHFETKDAVLLHFYDELGDEIAAKILDQGDDVPAWIAVANAFAVIEEFLSLATDRVAHSQLARIIDDSPRLHAARNYRRRHNVERAARALLERESRAGREMSPLIASAVAGSAFSCLYSAEKVYLHDASADATDTFVTVATGLFEQIGLAQAYSLASAEAQG
ncbi:TetR/AcrR family transcriptional regulator [Demequina capsici]|uniref:TetR family transcriptional regulator n=1 Tax=Demequina capsici TaxID=3075620 RepID=A0AA96FCJ6_9MICO|nr:TetR family transcriptional regulator [Demequina sp. OYTSA14]WNM25835.1 TetR family transcriptional regulator [Demequina sp. OYTSA14]